MGSFSFSRRSCSSTACITAASLLSWVALSVTGVNALDYNERHLPTLNSDQVNAVQYAHDISSSNPPSSHDFTLRHVFHRGTKKHPKLHRRLDIQAGMLAYNHKPQHLAGMEGVWADVGPFSAGSSSLQIQRLEDRRVDRLVGMEAHAREHGYRPILPESDWTIDEVDGPNVTDKTTVISLAKMAACAYNQGPDDPEWLDVGEPFNRSVDFGWQGDGLRGHVFADKKNETIVISIKGTSKAVFDGAETTTNDKENDNLFFGCCCGQGGSALLRPVCDCATDTYTCNNTCVSEELKKQNRYWKASIDLYDNVTALYPNTSNIWLVGHSLGGSVASLLGLTIGQPVVAFEAPGEALAAKRLGLPVPPGLNSTTPPQKRSLTGAFHFGHNADPVFTGTCNGWGASCVIGGYALETQCHTGMRCEYDAQGELGWSNIMTHHGIRVCISEVYQVLGLPKCVPDADCDSDCFKWKYFESNGSDVTTTKTSMTSTSITLTRTETCKTHGWWGWLDESTTVSYTTTMTTTLTTTTCSSYGWFGRCLDPITTTATLTSTIAKATSTAPTSTESTSTETCKTPGWFGRCLDDDTSVPTWWPTSEDVATATATATQGQITPAPNLPFELR